MLSTPIAPSKSHRMGKLQGKAAEHRSARKEEGSHQTSKIIEQLTEDQIAEFKEA